MIQQGEYVQIRYYYAPIQDGPIGHVRTQVWLPVKCYLCDELIYLLGDILE